MAIPHLGDNRLVCDEIAGTANRILMGYIPTPVSFLERALTFACPSGCIIHYHYTCKQVDSLRKRV